jgi:hypothetical protein
MYALWTDENEARISNVQSFLSNLVAVTSFSLVSLLYYALMITVFWDVAPYSVADKYYRIGGFFCLRQAQTTGSSSTLTCTYKAAGCQILQNSNIYSHRHESLKTYIIVYLDLTHIAES